MCRPKFPRLARWCRRRCLGVMLIPGALGLALGCTSLQSPDKMPSPLASASPPPSPSASASPYATVSQTGGQELRRLPSRPPGYSPAPSQQQVQPNRQTPVQEAAPLARLGFSSSDPNKVVPISLDTVLRLAESQNGQTAVARHKLEEAFADQDLAAKAWLPDFWVGASWYRHEGGISNEDGTITRSSFSALFTGMELGGRFDLREATYKKVEAERQVWQQCGGGRRVQHGFVAGSVFGLCRFAVGPCRRGDHRQNAGQPGGLA